MALKKKKKKKNPLNPYILSEMEQDDQRIGSLVDQGEVIKEGNRNVRTKTNESTNTFT
tara:strand:+ start:587 stop:760 length:174 start_codon:yes stop_codon:yes gene_type:complete